MSEFESTDFQKIDELERQVTRRIVLAYVGVGLTALALTVSLSFVIRDQVNLLAQVNRHDKHTFNADPGWLTIVSSQPIVSVTHPQPEPLLREPTAEAASISPEKTDSVNQRYQEARQQVQQDKPALETSVIKNVPLKSSPEVALPSLPSGFQPQWQPLSLDENKIHLTVLNKPFALKQTQGGTGAEYYTYAGYIYRQIGSELDRQAGRANILGGHFKELAAVSEQMAADLRQATMMHYDGPPSEDMEHLQVRANIMFSLGNLNPNGLRTIDLDQNGRLLHGPGSAPTKTRGALLQKYDAILGKIAAHAESQHYPKTMMLVKRQSELLHQLASNLELRWESVYQCQSTSICRDVPSHMRVYVKQSMPGQKVSIAMDSAYKG